MSERINTASTRRVIFYEPGDNGGQVSGVAFKLFPCAENGLSSFHGNRELGLEMVLPLILEEGYRPIILSGQSHVETVQIDKKPVRISYSPLDYERVDYLIEALCKAGAFDKL